jgi:hypothetical protein
VAVRSGQSLIVCLAEERKQISREIRLAAKKEKKKIKADAKRQRKQNAILHRRAVGFRIFYNSIK